MKCTGLAITLSFMMFSCTTDKVKSASGVQNLDNTGENVQKVNWYSGVDISTLSADSAGRVMIPHLPGYQQTEEYTCGPAALLGLADFYKNPKINRDKATEMQIAQEANTKSGDSVLLPGEQAGTSPENMTKWLNDNGFDAKLEFEDKGDASQLEKLKANLDAGIPTIVLWADLSGHYVIAVGYDTLGNDDPWDDIIIFADSYDKYDTVPDGYTYTNINKFYWSWVGNLFSPKIVWRAMITATPKKI